MRKLALLLLASEVCMLGQGSRFPVVIGFTPGPGSGALTSTFFNTNAANAYGAFGFRLISTKTINNVYVYSTTAVGTCNSTGCSISAEIDADSGGHASGTAIESHTLTVTGSGLLTFSGFTGSYTAGTQYWVVIKNLDATPASNYVAINTGAQYLANNVLSTFGAGSTFVNQVGWGFQRSTDGGTTWSATLAPNTVGLKLGFSDSTYDGFMATGAVATTTANGVYSANQTGVKFTTPSNGVTMNVVGLSFFVAPVVGSPTGNLEYKIYTGSTTTPTLLDTTGTVSASQMGTSNKGWIALYFASTHAIAPGTTLRVTIAESTQSDANTNRYNGYVFTIDGSASSEALTPFGATVETTTADGTTFSDTATGLLPFALILDGATPFSTTGGGGTFGAVN